MDTTLSAEGTRAESMTLRQIAQTIEAYSRAAPSLSSGYAVGGGQACVALLQAGRYSLEKRNTEEFTMKPSTPTLPICPALTATNLKLLSQEHLTVPFATGLLLRPPPTARSSCNAAQTSTDCDEYGVSNQVFQSLFTI
jgi:hypothetical protein